MTRACGRTVSRASEPYYYRELACKGILLQVVVMGPALTALYTSLSERDGRRTPAEQAIFLELESLFGSSPQGVFSTLFENGPQKNLHWDNIRLEIVVGPKPKPDENPRHDCGMNGCPNGVWSAP
jgi:hypothetical protein